MVVLKSTFYVKGLKIMNIKQRVENIKRRFKFFDEELSKI